MERNTNHPNWCSIYLYACINSVQSVKCSAAQCSASPGTSASSWLRRPGSGPAIACGSRCPSSRPGCIASDRLVDLMPPPRPKRPLSWAPESAIRRRASAAAVASSISLAESGIRCEQVCIYIHVQLIGANGNFHPHNMSVELTSR